MACGFFERNTSIAALLQSVTVYTVLCFFFYFVTNTGSKSCTLVNHIIILTIIDNVSPYLAEEMD